MNSPSTERASDNERASLGERHFCGPSRFLAGCLFSAVLSQLCQISQSTVTPCATQSNTYLGFAPLGQGIDYPGNDVQYSTGMTLEECLRACITYPGRDCIMVTSTTAGECWLKNGIGPDTAANSHVLGFALPCYVQSTCTKSLCDQSVELPSVQCQCTPPGDSGFAPADPFNAWYEGFDLTWGGTFTVENSMGCVSACQNLDIGCVAALYNPRTRLCKLKRQFVPSSAVPDPEWQAFVNYCATPNNGNCGHETCKSSPLDPSEACIQPSVFNFEYLSTNFSFQGLDIISYPGTDSASCVELCEANPVCMIAQVDPSQLHCWLKLGANTAVGSPGRVAFNRIGYNTSEVPIPGTQFPSMP